MSVSQTVRQSASQPQQVDIENCLSENCDKLIASFLVRNANWTMLPCMNRRSVQIAANGKYILRNVSEFDRGKKFYELTVDEDEQEIKNRPNPLADIEHKINESKKKMVWRQPFEKPFSIATEILGIFATERQKAAHLQRITKPLRLDMTVKTFLKEHESRRSEMEAMLQSFIPERHSILGNNLAAAHFLVHRGAEVR